MTTVDEPEASIDGLHLGPFVSRHHLDLLQGTRRWQTADGTLLFADVAASPRSTNA